MFSLSSLWKETLSTESKGLGVQGWPAHSAGGTTKRRGAVTHRYFSLHRAALHNESPLSSELEITQRRSELSPAVALSCVTLSRFWCCINAVLLICNYSSSVTVCVSLSLCRVTYCAFLWGVWGFVWEVCVFLCILLVVEQSDLEKQCYFWLLACRRTRLFISRAPCEAHCLFRGEEVWLNPVAYSRGGLTAPYHLVWLKYKYCLKRLLSLHDKITELWN